MKKRCTILKKLLLAALFCCSFYCSTAQGFSKDILLAFHNWPGYTAIGEYYRLNNYQFSWVGDKKLQDELYTLLDQAEYLGLEQRDYQAARIKDFRNSTVLQKIEDSVEIDIAFTDAALHFMNDLAVGNHTPSFRYAGLKYIPAVTDLPDKLLDAVSRRKLHKLALDLQPGTEEYYAIIARLNWFLYVTNETGFKDARIVSPDISNRNTPLLQRLYQLRVTDSVEYNISDKELLKKIKTAITEFDVLNDGKLRSTTLAALNVPLIKRIKELNTALNYNRWLNQIRHLSSVLILNIPSAEFTVFDRGKVLFRSNAIVGKRSTPTPVLTSKITEVIIYPYWMVPYKIATRELLPAIKRNPGYLEANNYQVVNSQGKVVNPYSINWHALSTSYFPYTIRQSTGCDNALGIVKFNFYNPFTVYLHDTPSKSLFTLNKRYFSHGCMRVEKPIDLAHFLLGFNSIAIDTITAKGCLNKKSPIVVPVDKPLPVIIVYSTAWFTKEGNIRFYDDIYNRL
jgi:L,D-transpeptidase YcbB